jgi:hypothetical protein
MFITSDINLAAYLRVKGGKCSIGRKGGRGEFTFDNDLKDVITSFYENEGDFLLYSQTIRAMKSQIMNIGQPKGDING